jgi:hypothetical protein
MAVAIPDVEDLHAEAGEEPGHRLRLPEPEQRRIGFSTCS